MNTFQSIMLLTIQFLTIPIAFYSTDIRIELFALAICAIGLIIELCDIQNKN
jgi:hypothetical protein